MATATGNEYNFFKGIFLLNCVFTFFLLVLLLLSSARSEAAMSYWWIFLGFLLFVALDFLVINPGTGGEVIDTITAEENQKWHPLQWTGIGMNVIFPLMVVVGLVWGGFYFYQITQLHAGPFISVPNLFSTMPVMPFFILNGINFDLLETSWTVGTIEESIWPGLLFPILWFIMFLVLTRFGVSEKPAILITLLLGAGLTGVLVSYVFHNVVYQGNLYAYADATGHFALSSVLAGVSGTTIAGIEAHAIHNAAVKVARPPGGYNIIPPPPPGGG